jgi:hypothetical protein
MISPFFDGFVKSPSAALRCNFVVAKGRGGSPSRPTSGNPAGCPYHRICAPCIWSFLRNHRLADFLRDHHYSMIRKMALLFEKIRAETIDFSVFVWY